MQSTIVIEDVDNIHFLDMEIIKSSSDFIDSHLNAEW